MGLTRFTFCQEDVELYYESMKQVHSKFDMLRLVLGSYLDALLPVAVLNSGDHKSGEHFTVEISFLNALC